MQNGYCITQLPEARGTEYLVAMLIKELSYLDIAAHAIIPAPWMCIDVKWAENLGTVCSG